MSASIIGGRACALTNDVMDVAKAALDASVRYLAWDLGFKNIRVNAIWAGPVLSEDARNMMARRSTWTPATTDGM